MANPVSHVTRVRWKWLFGVVLVAYGAYALIQRWLFWHWEDHWNIADIAVEPGALLLGAWLLQAALRGTRERLRYGAVTVHSNPTPARPGAALALQINAASGIAAGDRVALELICQFAEPDSDGVNYVERWRLRDDCVAQNAAGGVQINATFVLPATPPALSPTGQNYEVLTLHATHGGGLDREFKLDWRWQG